MIDLVFLSSPKYSSPKAIVAAVAAHASTEYKGMKVFTGIYVQKNKQDLPYNFSSTKPKPPLQNLTSLAGDLVPDVSGTDGGDPGVGEAAGAQRALGGQVGAAAEVDVLGDGIAGLGRILEQDGLVGAVVEGGALHKGLAAHAGVDAARHDGVVVAVDHVEGAEAEQGSARVDPLPVVVGIRHAQLAAVLAGVAVRVADQGGLPAVGWALRLAFDGKKC